MSQTVNYQDVETAKAQQSSDILRSGNFSATIIRAGVKSDFEELQLMLRTIAEGEPDIHAYASGAVFQDLLREFSPTNKENPFDNQALFGQTSPLSATNAIITTRQALQRVSNVLDLVKRAINLIDIIYDRVDNIVSTSNSEFVSTIPRTENLLVWANRVGAVLNPGVVGIKALRIQTKSSRTTTDLYGLLDLLDKLTLELQTLLVLPAYYRTATSSDTSNLDVPVKTIFVKNGETLEEIAYRELGNSDRSSLIMEYNNLTPEDIQGEGWNGRKINIPYADPVDSDRIRNNFVLDGQIGIQALGIDLPNELSSRNGDLEALDYTNTFLQSLDNILQTSVGGIPEQPEYGNRIIELDAQSGAPQLFGPMTSVEVRRALMTNPRVQNAEVLSAVKDGAKFIIKTQIVAINRLAEAELNSSLDLL